MLHFVDVILKDVLAQGHDYKWAQPPHCPRCFHCKVWGHGFVNRIFDHFIAPLPIKRFRCDQCGYLGIDDDTVWSIIQEDVPILLSALEQIQASK